MLAKEPLSRFKVDPPLWDVGWPLTVGHSVHFEYQLPDGINADFASAPTGAGPRCVRIPRLGRESRASEKRTLSDAKQFGVSVIFRADRQEARM